jgi:hypothetical protein
MKPFPVNEHLAIALDETNWLSVSPDTAFTVGAFADERAPRP